MPRRVSENQMWTWNQAGEIVLYGILTVSTILILLTFLTRFLGIVISKIEKGRKSTEVGKGDTEKRGD